MRRGPLSLADPVAGFREGGGQLGGGSQPSVHTPKTENSTDLTHYFLDGPKFTFEKIKAFWELLGAKIHNECILTKIHSSWALGA